MLENILGGYSKNPKLPQKKKKIFRKIQQNLRINAS